MAMKETVGSLRAYFFVAGVLSAVSNIKQLGSPVTGVVINSLLDLSIGAGFVTAGFLLQRELARGAGRILQTLVGLGVGQVASFALAAATLDKVPGTAIGWLVAGLLITSYLYRNVKRLARAA